jgi:TPP-dependent pyruvate/acetoin dehydrogenase alpha subunit
MEITKKELKQMYRDMVVIRYVYALGARGAIPT